jgi:hypothetical protein
MRALVMQISGNENLRSLEAGLGTHHSPVVVYAEVYLLYSLKSLIESPYMYLSEVYYII